MDYARLRAPLAILREVLGEPADDDHGLEKTSTAFIYTFEGRDITVHDFHKEEWTETPLCRTDSHYVWSVSGPDLEPFCRWLSGEVMRRMSAGRSLDQADRARIDALLATGVSMNDAMKTVRMVTDDKSAVYAWPPPDDDRLPSVAGAPAETRPVPKPTDSPAAAILRRRKK